MAFSISYLYTIIDRYTRPLNRIGNATNRFTNTARTAASRVGAMTRNMANLKNVASASAIGLAAVFPVKKAIDFEFAMADVLKVLDDISPKQLVKLEKEMFKTSVALARLPVGIAEIVTEGGKLGIPIEQLGRFTRLAGKTAIAFDIIDKEASRSIGKIKSVLRLSVRETEDLLDAINFLGDNTNAQVGGILEIVQRLSGTMATIKMPKRFIAGWAAIAEIAEVSPRRAATGMEIMVREMQKMPGMMAKLLKAPNKTIADFLKKVEGMSDIRRQRFLERQFGEQAAAFIAKLVTKIDLLDETLDLVANKTKFLGSMQRELNKKMATAKFQIDRIKSAWRVFLIIVGRSVLPLIKKLTPSVIKLVDKFKALADVNPSLSRFGILVAGAVTVVTSLAIGIGIFSTVLGGLATPILIAYAAVTALVGGYILWTSKNKTLISAMDKLWNAVSPIGELFKRTYNVLADIFDIISPGITIVDALAVAIIGVADVLEMVLSPFVAFSSLINGLIKGDISGGLAAAGKALYKGAVFGDMPKPKQPMDWGIAYQIATAKPVTGGVAGQTATVMQGTLNGNINFKSDIPGVVKATMESSLPGNLGMNMQPEGSF